MGDRMALTLVDSLSVPGDVHKANEDAFAVRPEGAVVLDGATSLGDPLLPGASDAAWVARFGANRLMAHLEAGLSGAEAVDAALVDAERSFSALRRRQPQETWEIPFASMMLCVDVGDGIDALWFGDCAALIAVPGKPAIIVGDALDTKQAERERVAALAARTKLAPTQGPSRAEFLPALRRARNRVNTKEGAFLFGPHRAAIGQVRTRRLALPRDTQILLASDGFLALVSEYGLYDLDGLIRRAGEGLSRLGEELRRTEDGDPDGVRFPRFKRSDDATALLLRLS